MLRRLLASLSGQLRGLLPKFGLSCWNCFSLTFQTDMKYHSLIKLVLIDFIFSCRRSGKVSSAATFVDLTRVPYTFRSCFRG